MPQLEHVDIAGISSFELADLRLSRLAFECFLLGSAISFLLVIAYWSVASVASVASTLQDAIDAIDAIDYFLFLMISYVSLAMRSSSLVGTIMNFVVLETTLFKSLLMLSKIQGLFSPIPAVNITASRPPIAA